MVRNAVRDERLDLKYVETTETESYSMKPAQFVLYEQMDSEVREELLNGIDQMGFAELDLKIINKGEGNLLNISYYYLYYYLLEYFLPIPFKLKIV